MKKATKLGMACVSAVVSLGAVVGCGSTGSTGSSNSGGGSSTASGSTTVTVWNVDSGAAQQVDNKNISDFNKANPNIHVQAQYFESNPYLQKLQIVMGAHQAPDIFTNWGGGRLKAYIDPGDVVDLTPYLNADPNWKNKFLPSIMKSVTFDGKVYGVPHGNIQPVNFFYDKQLFQKYNVTPPKTWDELLADVKLFKSKGIAPIALGGKDNWPDLMYFEYMVDRLGGQQPFNDILAGKPNAWSNPVIIQACTMLQQLVEAGAFEQGFSSVGSNDGEDAALLYSGKAAMWLMGAWGYGSILSNDSGFMPNLGWFAFPAVTGGKGDPKDVAGNPSNFFSVSTDSKNVKAAVKFLEDGNMNDQNIKDLIGIGYVPPVQGIGSELAQAKNGAYMSFYYNLAVQAPYFQQSWDTILPTAEGNQLDTDLGKLFINQLTPQTFAADMNQYLNKG